MAEKSKRKYETPALVSVKIDNAASLVMTTDETTPPIGPYSVSSESSSVFPDEPFEDSKKSGYNSRRSPFDD